MISQIPPFNELSVEDFLKVLLSFLTIGYLLNYTVFRFNETVLSKRGLYYNKKLGLLAAATGIFSISLIAIAFLNWKLFLRQSVPLITQLQAAVIYGIATLAATLFHETIQLAKKEKKRSDHLLEAEAKLLAVELKTLQVELGPHFLFNCMTALSQLLAQNRAGAEKFIHKLQSVYLYFVRNNEREWIHLREELHFLTDYTYLLQIRHGEALMIRQSLPPALSETLILPGTLQLLVENCIKHNRFSAENPLQVDVREENGYLVVENNLLPKFQVVSPVTRLGLRNLERRYRLLTGTGLQVSKEERWFRVRIPVVAQINAL